MALLTLFLLSNNQAVLNGQIGEVEQKIAELDAIRDGLKRGLLGLREEELELEDERKVNPLRAH